MTNASTLFGSGSGEEVIQTILLEESGTFVPEHDCEAYVHVFGGGGGGGASNTRAGTGYYSIATGGGSGAYALSRLSFTEGTSYTVTVGAGGLGGDANTDPESADGTAGGSTSISGSGITTMTAGGGIKGIASHNEGASGTETLTQTDSVPTASGGNIFNHDGVEAGDAIAGGGNFWYRAAASGGAAINLSGTSTNHTSGDASATVDDGAAASGGAGLKGASSAATNAASDRGDGFLRYEKQFLGFLVGNTENGASEAISDNTAYGRGTSGQINSTGPAGTASMWAGGGAHAMANGSASDQNADNGGLGGGGGGAAYTNDATNARDATGGNGGDGLIVIQIVKVNARTA